MSAPWVKDVHRQCQVMNRVASMCGYMSLEDMHGVLDRATEMLWEKVAEHKGRSIETTRQSHFMRGTV